MLPSLSTVAGTTLANGCLAVAVPAAAQNADASSTRQPIARNAIEASPVSPFIRISVTNT